MSFVEYVKDKRYFMLLFAVVMLFVSAVMFLGNGGAGNLLYVNTGCFLLAAAYVTVGYYYRRTFYEELRERLKNDAEALDVPLPEPQNGGQRLIVAFLRSRDKRFSDRLGKLREEKRDHQDYIMSWIHEVKLPIAASRLLLENGTGMPVDDLIDKLEDELAQIENDVEQALYYSRIDSFSKDYFITEVPLHTLVKESVKKSAKPFITKRIRLTMPEDAFYVHSDSKWLAYIVDQLVADSLKYTGEGGTVAFAMEEDDREKRLLVRDSGIGIVPEDLPRVFDKGFTGANGRAYAKSTGMGLYLAKQLALKLGHDLSVRSVEGSFTELTVHFPKLRNYYRL
jgi:signal transduction histidine kinase